MPKKVYKSAKNKVISFFLIQLFMASTCAEVISSEVNAVNQAQQRANLSPTLKLHNIALANMFMLHEGMQRASEKVARQISQEDKRKIETWVEEGILKILPKGKTIEGQDENVIGYSELLLLSDEEKKQMNEKVFLFMMLIRH